MGCEVACARLWGHSSGHNPIAGPRESTTEPPVPQQQDSTQFPQPQPPDTELYMLLTWPLTPEPSLLPGPGAWEAKALGPAPGQIAGSS